jgi:hypothetical protein
MVLTIRSYDEARKKNTTRLFIVKHLVFIPCLPRLSGEQTRTISDKAIRILVPSASPHHVKIN